MQLSGYRFGRVEVDGIPWREDLWICAGKTGSWRRKEGHWVHPEDLAEVLEFLPETVIIGTGAYGMLKVSREAQEFLAQEGIELIAVPTKDAVQRYHELALKKRVAALLHLTC